MLKLNRSNRSFVWGIITLLVIILAIYAPVFAQGGTLIYLPLIFKKNAANAPPMGPVSDVLPDPDAGILVRPDNGACPAGTHLVHNSGLPGIYEPDTDIYADTNYTCEPDQTLADAGCSAKGTAILSNGVAGCACKTGYAGASCNVCAPGYEPDNAQQCVPSRTLPPPTIEGLANSLTFGETTTLTAKDEAGNFVEATWEITPSIRAGQSAANDTTGCLYDLLDPQTCRTAITGAEIGYRAPITMSQGQSVEMVPLHITPTAGGLGFATKSVVIVEPGAIAITGYGDARLAPILDALTRFMRQRCVGAATLGVARYGNPLAVYGLGRMTGRAADDWPAYCGDDMAAPLGDRVTNETPMRIGSISKTQTFAILRWTLKERLKDLDTDLTATPLTETRFVAAERAEDGSLKLTVRGVEAAQIVSRGVATATYPTNGNNIKASDFSLIALSAGRFVLAVHTKAKSYLLSTWDVAENGDLQHLDDYTLAGTDGSAVKSVALTALLDNSVGTDRFVAANRTADGDLTLWSFHVTSAGEIQSLNSLVLLNSHTREAALTDVSDSTTSRIVVGVRDYDNDLVLRTYQIAANGTFQLEDGTTASGPIDSLELAAVSANQFVSAARTGNSNLKLVSWHVAADGQLAQQYDSQSDPVIKFSLTEVGGQLVTASRLAGDTVELRAWEIDGEGHLTQSASQVRNTARSLHMIGMSATTLLLSRRSPDDTITDAYWAYSADRNRFTFILDTPTGSATTDYNWSDSEIEALGLLNYDLPELLLPKRLHAILSGLQSPPVLVNDQGDACTPVTTTADPQWRQVTIGHVLSHRMGLPRSAPDHKAVDVPSLPVLRNLTTEADYIAQEAQLKAEFGEGLVDSGKASLGYPADTTLYVVPRPTLLEKLINVAGRCLRYSLGSYHYANTTPAFAATVITHVLGVPYAAPFGYPEKHNGSALDLFYAQTLGVETTASTGIFDSQRVYLPGYNYPEPRSRHWSSFQNTYYPYGLDLKRPHCVWDGSTCSFADWSDDNIAKDKGRLHWYFFNASVPFDQTSGAASDGSIGGLATAPGVLLSYMRKYWIGGYQSNPTVGEPRNNVWDMTEGHNGAAAGFRAEAIQLGGTGIPTRFNLPRDTHTGYLPKTENDTFKQTEPAYFIVDHQTGGVKTYNSDGAQTETLDAGYQAGDGFAVGPNRKTADANNFYIAHHNTGMVDVYSTLLFVGPHTSFQAGFAEGDAFLVDLALNKDTRAEVLVVSAATGQARLFTDVGDPIPFTSQVDALDIGFEPGDKVGLGDLQGHGVDEIYLAKASTGDVEIYSLNLDKIPADGVPDPLRVVAVGYAAGDSFAVGDVVGSDNRDEIIVGRVANQTLAVYKYSGSANSYAQYTAFNFLVGSDIVVNNLTFDASAHNQIVIGYSASGEVLVLQAKKGDNGTQFWFTTFIGHAFNPGDKLAAGYGSGRQTYTCALPNGQEQGLPDGVDIFVALNQWDDKQCQEAGSYSENDKNEDSCEEYYNLLANTMKYGVCQIDWSGIIK